MAEHFTFNQFREKEIYISKESFTSKTFPHIQSTMILKRMKPRYCVNFNLLFKLIENEGQVTPAGDVLYNF